MQEFFRTNYLLVSFGHGLVFFLLGFAIAITLRHSPRSTLRLARSLKFVAAFGVLYGVAEWGATFIPLQSTYLPDDTLLGLRVFRLLVLVGSFTALGWFGHSLLAPPRGLPTWLKMIPPVAAVLWLLGMFLHPTLQGGADPDRWLTLWELIARFMLGLPATLVGAFALWEQRPEMERLGFVVARGYLQGAAITMVVFAFAGGLLDPRVGAVTDILNRDFLFRTIGIPLEVVRASAGLALTGFFVLVLEALAYDTRRQLEEAERRRLVLEERHRIGQELHDGVIQRIYAATLYLEGASVTLESHPRQATENLRSALDQLDDTIHYIRQHLVAGGGLPLRMSTTAAGPNAPGQAEGAASPGEGSHEDESHPDPDR